MELGRCRASRRKRSRVEIGDVGEQLHEHRQQDNRVVVDPLQVGPPHRPPVARRPTRASCDDLPYPAGAYTTATRPTAWDSRSATTAPTDTSTRSTGAENLAR